MHWLGINPADESLLIATHTGLFRVADDEAEATRIGDRRQDAMGLTVVGPDRFSVRAAPDARDELPPLLGPIGPTTLVGPGIRSRSRLRLTSMCFWHPDPGSTASTPPTRVVDE